MSTSFPHLFMFLSFPSKEHVSKMPTMGAKVLTEVAARHSLMAPVLLEPSARILCSTLQEIRACEISQLNDPKKLFHLT